LAVYVFLWLVALGAIFLLAQAIPPPPPPVEIVASRATGRLSLLQALFQRISPLRSLQASSGFRDAQIAYWLEGKARPSHVPRWNLLDNVIRPALANRL
jgi:hypothetical protein